ncbi:MAG: alpha,alpha-trehalose-phosphate synthase (UDP-forming) [Bacillota bacterium]
MRISFRFLIPLVVALFAVAYFVTPIADGLMRQWNMRDLDIRASLLASSLQDTLYETLNTSGGEIRTANVLANLIRDERLYGVAVCDLQGELIQASVGFPANIKCRPDEKETSRVVDLPEGPIHVAVRDLTNDGKKFASLVVVHDMSFAQRRSETTKRYLFYLIAAIAGIVSLITVVIAEFSWWGFIRSVRGILTARGVQRPGATERADLAPVARDLRSLIQDLEAERGMRDEAQVNWSPESLRHILRNDLHGEEVLIISNREPYIHDKRDGKVFLRRPASGLVTALEPVMRACSGTWIAHGSGTADREAVDRHDHVAVPPDRPAYTLRRMWLTKEQEKGYYYGFANSGLWPLCHIAHVRPTFRSEDYEVYEAVNQKFADAVLAEAKSRDPIVMVQDYHFALLPRQVRERMPDATIITFWHIPWPNPETFGICPWRKELLEGLLGSTILGFHTQFHCNNFMDCVDRYLEARVDRETFTVTLRGKTTAVRRYPISIDWPLQSSAMEKPIEQCRKEIRALNDLAEDVKVGVGVDRLDYTKGILERMQSVERLLEQKPEWIGRFSFVQIAAPSRTDIPEYQRFDEEVRATEKRINERFAKGRWRPIVLLIEHHEPQQVYEYYRGSDLAIVSSLHDGMNLVAKEYIAARDDEQGVLILSQFTGASRELPEAIIVNPYDIDQCAHALHLALTMPEKEQRARMRSMRGMVQEFNVYRWAGRMLLDAAHTRMQQRVLRYSAAA